MEASIEIDLLPSKEAEASMEVDGRFQEVDGNSCMKVTVQRLPRCFSDGRLPSRKRNRADTVVADYCTTQTVVADYRASVNVQMPWLENTLLRKPWRSITAQAYPSKRRGFRLLYQANRGGRKPR